LPREASDERALSPGDVRDERDRRVAIADTMRG